MDTHLFIDIPNVVFRPAAIVRGKLLWSVAIPPQEIHLTLGWGTEGRGTVDTKIECELKWATDALAGEEPFVFQLPASPYSFSGQLISLSWSLAVSTRKGKASTHLDIVVSPYGTPIDLPFIDEGRKKSFSLFGNR